MTCGRCDCSTRCSSLVEHHLLVADHPAQRRLVDHGPQSQRVLRRVDPVLSPRPYVDALLDVRRRGLGKRAVDQRLGVRPGLEQARDHLGLVHAQRLRVGLQTDVDAVRDVAEGVPPALLAGVLRHLHQRVDDAVVLDLVHPAEVAHIALADGPAAVLQAADLRLRDQQPLRHFLGRHAFEFAQAAQFLAQPASPDSGIDVGRHGNGTSGYVAVRIYCSADCHPLPRPRWETATRGTRGARTGAREGAQAHGAAGSGDYRLPRAWCGSRTGSCDD